MFVLCAMLMGCQRENPNTAGNQVAVVDIEQIARATGFDKILNEQLGKLNTELGNELQKLQSDIRTQLKQKQEALGKTPTDQEKQEFNKLSTELDQKYRQQLNNAQDQTNQMHAMLVGQFRQQMEPAIQTIAAKRGFQIVLSKNESIIIVQPAADITQDAIALLGQQQNVSQPVLPAKLPADDMLTPKPVEPSEQPSQTQPTLPIPDSDQLQIQ